MTLGSFETYLGDFETSLGNFEMYLGDFETSLGNFEMYLGDFETSLGNFEMYLGNFGMSLGNFEMDLGKNGMSLAAKGVALEVFRMVLPIHGAFPPAEQSSCARVEVFPPFEGTAPPEQSQPLHLRQQQPVTVPIQIPEKVSQIAEPAAFLGIREARLWLAIRSTWAFIARRYGETKRRRLRERLL